MGSATVLCLINGPWQALSLAASLRELGLAAPETRLVGLLVDMPGAGPLQAATCRILRANGVTELHGVPRETALGSLPASIRALERRAAVELARVDMVAAYGVHRPIARYVLNLCPRADILLYEEGLRTYVGSEGSWQARAGAGLARLWGRVDPTFELAFRPPRSRKRDYAYALLLGDRLPLPAELHGARVHHVSSRHLRDAMAGVSAPGVRELPERPYTLIVGQYYARLKQISRQAELEAYALAALHIAARGQIPIWRGHPREGDATFGALRARCPSLRDFGELAEDTSLPLELYADLFGPRCAGVVSFSSSALFYLGRLHGVAAHTLLDPAWVQDMSSPHRDACALALAHVPRFLDRGRSWRPRPDGAGYERPT
jgi:hypothetical protein